ncbi:MAG: TrpR like protein, YerC/YecD [Succiniclasticum sp.]|jgi:TrpR-related protein YerC/YecD
MSEKIENKLTEQLCNAILSLKTAQEVSNFLEDVCTISEYRALAQRFEVARLLDEGIKYEDIVARTGASTATISRVKRCLVYGKDGYLTALANLKAERHEGRTPRLQRKVQFEKERAELKRQVQDYD